MNDVSKVLKVKLPIAIIICALLASCASRQSPHTPPKTMREVEWKLPTGYDDYNP